MIVLTTTESDSICWYLILLVSTKSPKQQGNHFPHTFISTLKTYTETLVFIGLSFTPMLSGDKSSGEMHNGLRGLLGLPMNWHGLKNPYQAKKYSIGISIACGCSSVTNDPQALT